MKFRIKDENGTLMTIEKTLEGVIDYLLKALEANDIKLRVEL